MALLTFDEFKKTDSYNQFISNNSAFGHLKIQAFTAYQAIPLPDVEILITKQIENNVVIFFKGFTNSSGIINDIKLPAPVDNTDLSLYQVPNYSLYDLTAVKHDYESLKKYNIGMFDGVRILQYVKMSPEVKE